jgi:TRAP transporter TAXI family solute receptor
VLALRDGSIDGFFWSGGVPTGAVTDLATTDDIRLLDIAEYKDSLLSEYGEAYQDATVEADEYSGVESVRTIGVPNVLMVNESMSDDLAYNVTKALYEGKDRLAIIVPAAESLAEEEGQKTIDPIELHPGAQRYYDDQGR